MLRDLRFGFRLALRSPVWALGIVLSLAIGIGATVTIASAVNALLLYRIPVARPGELVELENSIAGRGVEQNLTDFRHLRETTGQFAEMAAYNAAQAFQLEDERVWGQLVSENYFDVLQLRPVVGRFFSNDTRVAVLSESLWRRRFAGDPSIIGRTVRINGQAVTVAGIAPAAFRGIHAGYLPALWLPLRDGRVLNPHGFPPKDEWTGVSVFARLRTGVSLPQAQAAIDVAAAQVDRAFPVAEHWLFSGARKVRLELAGQFLSNFRELAEMLLRLLSAMAAFVLLIACANAANLQLARGAARQREFDTRRALGATRARLVGQLTAESLTLGLLGGAGGIGVAHVLLGVISRFPLPELPVVLDLDMPISQPVAVFAVALTIGTTLASGLIAAWRNTGSAAHRHWLRDGLVVAQVALTVVLTVSTGLLVRSLHNVKQIDAGFHPEQTTFAQFDPLLAGYTPAQLEPLVRELLQTPGAAVSDSVPLTLGGRFADIGTAEGQPQALEYNVSAGFFDALRIPILAGRDFGAAGDKGRVLINEALARQLFKGESPIGRRIGKKSELEVIGVVRNHSHFFVGETPAPIVYQRLFHEPVTGPLTLSVREGPLPASRANFFHVRSGADQIASAIFVPRATAALISVFGGMGLFLTATGLYALMAYTVSRRMKELGIRIALGARPIDIARAVYRRSAVLTGLGTALGLGVAFGTTALLDDAIYGLSPHDPASFLAGTAALVVISALALWAPARRVSTNEPVDALRQE